MIGQGRQLAWDFDPLEALRRWPADSRPLLLHSGRYNPRWARRSILTRAEGVYRFIDDRRGPGRSEWSGGEAPAPFEFTHRPFHDLRQLLLASGIWVGYLSYDLARWVERLPSIASSDRDWPLIELGYCPGCLVYDGATRRWTACGAWMEGAFPDLGSLPPTTAYVDASHLRSAFTRDEHEAAVARALEYIAAGDIFQVNLAQRFTAKLSQSGREFYRAIFDRLAAVSPAWYGAYLELEGRRALASTSPELFLEVDPLRNVVTRPIKGTRPASVPAEELLRSEKDTAELNMIVDLLRNDLGRVCSYGSVKVSEPRTIESHPTVHHGVATVTGRLHENRDVIDLLRATMPGGSITGAPKVRAMEIIDELEPVRRGPYCGAIGYLSAQETCLNIAIRTMAIEGDRVDFSVGGGIVADSLPSGEYQETLDKAAAMLRALGLSSVRAPA